MAVNLNNFLYIHGEVVALHSSHHPRLLLHCLHSSSKNIESCHHSQWPTWGKGGGVGGLKQDANGHDAWKTQCQQQ